MLLLLLGIGGSGAQPAAARRGAFYPTQEELREARIRLDEKEKEQTALEARIAETIEAAWDAALEKLEPKKVEKPAPQKVQVEEPEELPRPSVGPAQSRQLIGFLLRRGPAPPEIPKKPDDQEYLLFVGQLHKYERELQEFIEKHLDDDEILKAMDESTEYRRIKKYLDA